MMIEPAMPPLTLPLVGRVGARKRAGVGVFVIISNVSNADPHPRSLPTGGRAVVSAAQVH